MVDKKPKGESAITKTFSTLESAKQKRILDAAYKEFAEQGYAQASTNRIVKEAGIGKGMLFYYFKSKKELFYYLIDYGINFVINEYLSQIEESQTDFIEKYKQASLVKMEAVATNRDIFNFFATIYLNNEVELPEKLNNRLLEVRNLGYAKIFNNIDTSLFRADVEPEKILKIIQWSMEGYEKELVSRLNGQKLSSIDYTPIWDEFYGYLAVLKKILYK